MISAAIPSGQKIVLTAHYDNFPGSCGYNDNASGVSLLLDLQDSVPDNVEIVFTDLEERGALGAGLFIRLSPPNSISFNINVDILSLGENLFYETYAQESFRIRIPPVEGLAYYGDVPINDSFAFRDQGISSVLIISSTDGNEGSMLHNVWQYQHNNRLDNNLSILSERGIVKAKDVVLKLIEMNRQ